MSTTTSQPAIPDPAALVRQLDPDAIRDRLDEIDREREALKVLLLAALRARREPNLPRAAAGCADG